MALIEKPDGSTTLELDAYLSSARCSEVPRGAAYAISEITGTVAAELGSGSCVFAMRASPGRSESVHVDRLRLAFVTGVAFTTPVVAARRLAVFRGAGAAASGGTAIATPAKKYSSDYSSVVAALESGDARIATTAALTTTGITWEDFPLATMSLSHVGDLGSYAEMLWDLSRAPIVLQPGQVLGVLNPAAMDAGGVWQLLVDIGWFELEI
jgi:hypothetical protein